MRVGTTFLREKYKVIEADTTNVKEIMDNIQTKIHREAKEAMEAPIMMGELETAVRMGKSNKTPGSDGINTEFFKIMWNTIKSDLLCIINEIFVEGMITDGQKKGLMLCVPKRSDPRGLQDYRTLTLLNADYKLLTRLIANRMQPWLTTALYQNQYCGTRGRTMLDAVATVRDAIANAQYTKSPLCVVTLDFTAAFDNISHDYLFAILKGYGFSDQMQQRIRQLYENTTSAVKINGHISQQIPIKCSIRQGCPLSMQLYALCLDPLLKELETIMTGCRIGRTQVTNTVIAYADDVTLLVKDPQDIPKIKEAIQKYETASGARINYAKSQAMAIGNWKTETELLNIPYVSQVKILGIHFTPSIQQTIHKNWAIKTNRIRGMAKAAYYREICLDKRISYVHAYILATAWYIAQILPLPTNCVRQINMAITWYIWRGEIFRVPLSTLQLPKKEGGWGLIDIEAKCKTLCVCRMRATRNDRGEITAEWLQKWVLTRQEENPPYVNRIPEQLEYLRIYALDSAYVHAREEAETERV